MYPSRLGGLVDSSVVSCLGAVNYMGMNVRVFGSEKWLKRGDIDK